MDQTSSTPLPPEFLGTLTTEERNQIFKAREEYSELQRSIGDIEVRKALLIQRALKIDADAQAVIQAIRDRIGLSDVSFSIQPDGTIVRVSDTLPV